MKKQRHKRKLPIFHVRYYWLRGVCNNPNHSGYRYFGARGIQMHWNKYREFEAWVLQNLGRPKGHKKWLSRIDFQGDFEPGNLRWATAKEKGNNGHRLNLFVDTPSGRMTSTEASRKYKINIHTLRYRVKHNWPLERIYQR